MTRTSEATIDAPHQKDEPLYAVHRLVNVPPVREAQLREVMTADGTTPNVQLSSR
jgi:hypothetical protein